MPRQSSFILSRLTTLILAALLLALLPTPASAAATVWRGEYFANPDLSGSPALVRSDANLNFNWGWGAPNSKLAADHFSVRWTRSVVFKGGGYRFNVSVDDGVRLYVDNQVLIDQWLITAPITYTAGINLTAGAHVLKVEYYENTERAQIRVWWEAGMAPVATATAAVAGWQRPALLSGWQGDYFENRSLEGDPEFERADAFVWFDWDDEGPGGGVDGTDFSVRWSRVVEFAGGTYRFKVTADDGVRVWIDWVAIIDEWHETSTRTYTAEHKLSSGTHTVVVEYFQASGSAEVKLEWEITGYPWVGNLATCMPAQKAWVKVYRLAPDNTWEDLKNEGYGPLAPDGKLQLFGLPVSALYGWDGQPYKVELWQNGARVRTEGDVLAGQKVLALQPGGAIQTSWPCGG